MLVRFWGTRGSIAVPGPGTVRYGGNTACVQVVTPTGHQIILDCGTGMRALGLHLAATLAPPVEASVLLSHTHWDHIQGIPFFAPAYQDGNALTFYAARGSNKQVRELLATAMETNYFPVRLDQLRARLGFQEVGEEAFPLADTVTESHYLHHTSPCLGYRISAGGATVVYATDHEPFSEAPLHPGGEIGHPRDRELAAFAQGADLLIHDAQYSDAEYPHKVGWGHSTLRYAASIGVAAGVKWLALFHHDPAHDDEFIDRQLEQVQALLTGVPGAPRVFAASEGQEWRLVGEEATVSPWREPAAA